MDLAIDWVAYGQYSLVLLAILLIIQNKTSKLDLINSVKPILIILIITVMLNIVLKTILTTYSVRTFNTVVYGHVSSFNSYLSIILIGFVILINIALAIKLNNHMKQLLFRGKILWALSTICLGLFPIILFNELILLKRKENNAA